MEKIKFRRAHFDNKDKFICFTYWGKIDHLKEHSDDCFMSPSMVSDSIRCVDSIMMDRKTDKDEEIYIGDVLHLLVAVSHSDDFMEEPEDIEQEMVVDVVWREETSGFDIDIIDKDVLVSGWCLGCGEEITLLGNIFEKPELINYKL